MSKASRMKNSMCFVCNTLHQLCYTKGSLPGQMCGTLPADASMERGECLLQRHKKVMSDPHLEPHLDQSSLA